MFTDSSSFDPDTDPQDDPDTSHDAPLINSLKDGPDDALQFDPSLASPSVLGEENPFSGDATDSESPDIDQALSDVGLANDSDGVKPLGD